MASRSPLALIPEMRELYKQFCAEMDKAGISWITTCTRRTQADQDELYARGRSKPGQIVTWTRKSRHIDGEAFDICILKNRKLCWDISNGDWKKAGEIGRKLGLDWGGSWTRNKDYPHFQYRKPKVVET